MGASKVRCGLLCFVILVVVQLQCALALEYFSSKCGQTIDISTDHSVQFDSQSSFSYESNQDCTVTIETSILQRVLVTFDSVNIEWSSDCGDADYLEIYDGSLPIVKLATICGSFTPSAVASTLPSITLRFKTDSLLEYTGFTIIVTSFSPGGFCGLDEFECDNGRCIDTSLKYNFYDNCGDSSDENFDFGPTFGYNDYNVYVRWSIGLIVGVIVGCIVGVILLSICCGCLCYHLCCKNQTPRTTTTVVVPPGNQQQPGAYVQQPGAPPPAYNQPPMAMQQTPGQYGLQQAPYNVKT